MRKYFPILFIFFLIHGCIWDNEEELYPTLSECDTSSVSYAGDIVPMLSSHCYRCHSNSNAPGSGGGIRLEDYGDVVSSASRISGAINHQSGYLPMPQGGGKLPSCPIRKFDAWISNNTPNN
jgi:hypothetical protein